MGAQAPERHVQLHAVFHDGPGRAPKILYNLQAELKGHQHFQEKDDSRFQNKRRFFKIVRESPRTETQH